MGIAEIENQLTTLFTETAKAHHDAFLTSDGKDPEWPLWYADYLQEPISEILQNKFLKSNLIYCMMNADYEFTARKMDVPWQKFYADHFIEHFAETETPTEDSLALYYFPTCPFCQRVLKTVDQLGIEVDLRNINENHEFRNDLISVRDRTTVPVLQITSPDGNERWMPESRDIINYLIKTYN